MFVFGTADDVYAMAVRIEENGSAFYTGAAQKTKEPGTRKLFEDLALMEESHVNFFKALRSGQPDQLLQAPVWDPEGLAESYLQATADSHIFTVEAAGSRLERVMSADQALDMAIEFEKDSVAFFIGMRELISVPDGKSEIDKLILAEMEHVRMLSRAKLQVARTGQADLD
jgi:rubrerythrin